MLILWYALSMKEDTLRYQDKYVQYIASKYNPQHTVSFSSKDADVKFLEPLKLSLRSLPPDHFGNNRASLTREEEHQLFVALHYMKYKINSLRRRCKRQRRYMFIYISIRNRIISSNCSLVFDCVQKHASRLKSNVDRSELIERGTESLINAADNFDPWRGFRFSTYACNAIKNGFFNRPTKSISVISVEEVDDVRKIAATQNENRALWIERLNKASSCLTHREINILIDRFKKKMKLHDVGKQLGITKERVRQIQNEALNTLKKKLLNDPILK